MNDWVLSIDFGTSYTTAAERSGGRPDTIELDGEGRIPSVIVVDGDTVVVGRAAEQLSRVRPWSTLREPKRRVGEPAPVVLDGRAFSVVDVVGAILRHAYREAMAFHATPPSEVRLTHPATWGRPRLGELVRAASLAGIEDPVLVPEPVAAAVAYALEGGIEPGRSVAVYDLGGGTLDTAVLRSTGAAFEVQGRPGGEPRLGGELFDELLMQHVVQGLPPDTAEAIYASSDRPWRQAAANLRLTVRDAKEALSTQTETEVLVATPVGMQSVRVARDAFENLIEPYVTESIDTLLRTVADAGLGPADLAAVYLVGGASRTPLVRRKLGEALPRVEVLQRGDPKFVVAWGATLPLGATRQAREVAAPEPPPPPAPAPVAGRPATLLEELAPAALTPRGATVSDEPAPVASAGTIVEPVAGASAGTIVEAPAPVASAGTIVEPASPAAPAAAVGSPPPLAGPSAPGGSIPPPAGGGSTGGSAGPPRPVEGPRRRRLFATLVVGGIVVLAGLVLALVAGVFGGSSAHAYPDTNEKALLGHLTEHVRDGCKRFPKLKEWPGALAGVVCTPMSGAASNVTYIQFRDNGPLKDHFDMLSTEKKFQTGKTCFNGSSSLQTTKSAGVAYDGMLLCFREGKQLGMDWTHDGQHVLAMATSSSDALQFINWYKSEGGPQ